MTDTSEVESLEKRSDEEFAIISDFARKYCTDEEERDAFFSAVSEYVDLNIELEKLCNQ